MSSCMSNDSIKYVHTDLAPDPALQLQSIELH